MSTTGRQERLAEDSVGAAAELLGDRWTFLILREAFFGTQRFNEFANNLGLSRNILSSRLKTLVAKGIFELRPYGPAETRNEYRLAQPGRDIFPIVVALLQWGDKYLMGPEGPSIILKHTRCGEDADPQLVCGSCGEPIELGEILPTPGPGATDWVRSRLSELPANAFQAGDSGEAADRETTASEPSAKR
jgi:DNA-binding HxlR family transcriptional regulator